MRVERRQHAVDRALDQGVIVDRNDIMLLHLLIHRHELLELGVIGGVGCRERGRGDGDKRKRADQGNRGQELSEGSHTGSYRQSRVI